MVKIVLNVGSSPTVVFIRDECRIIGIIRAPLAEVVVIGNTTDSKPVILGSNPSLCAVEQLTSVECHGLENRRSEIRSEGSNPSCSLS